MPPLFSRRFAILSAVTLALASLAFIFGAASAISIVGWIASLVGVGDRVFASQDDIVVQLVLTRIELGLVFALPLGVAWVAALIHRARSRTDPSAFALAAYLAVPLIAGVAAMLRQVLGWRFTNIPADLPVLTSFTDLTPDAGLTYIPLSGLVLWAAVFVRARREIRGR